MCGIIAVLGKDGTNAVPRLLQGLEKLEYRGYDSTGIAVMENGHIRVVKAAGKLENLVAKLKGMGSEVNSPA